MVKKLFQDEHFVVFVAFVAGDDDPFAFLQAFQYLVVLRVLASDADLAAVGFLAVFVEDENPVASRHLEEGAFRDEDALGGFARPLRIFSGRLPSKTRSVRKRPSRTSG